MAKKKVRKDSDFLRLEPGDNQKYLAHSLKMWDWKPVNMSDAEAVEERIVQYLKLCIDDDMKPSVAGLALAFSADRQTYFRWINGLESENVSVQARLILQKAHQTLNTQMEDYMQNGKINPVSGIFLMKNNMGYEDRSALIVQPENKFGAELSAEDLQKKYLQKAVPTELLEAAESAEKAESAEGQKGAESAESAERDPGEVL